MDCKCEMVDIGLELGSISMNGSVRVRVDLCSRATVIVRIVC